MFRWLLLFLLAWQGQVPWCHCHGTLVDGADGSQSWLVQHLRTHHASVFATANFFLGWHFHVDLLDSKGAPDKPPKVEQIRLASANVTNGLSQRVAENARLFCRSVDCVKLQPAVGSDHSLDFDSIGGSHFFDHFAPELSLPVRFGNLRC